METVSVPDRIGCAIKHLRRERGLTLRGLAEETEISPGFISKIENNQSKPSRGNLERICAVLETNREALFALAAEMGTAELGEDPSPDRRLLVPSGERRLLYDMNSLVRLEMLFRFQDGCTVEAMRLRGGSEDSLASEHTQDEVCIVSRGCALVRMLGREYTLAEGDALLIPAHTEHRVHKLSEEPCSAFLFKLSPDSGRD